MLPDESPRGARAMREYGTSIALIGRNPFDRFVTPLVDALLGVHHYELPTLGPVRCEPLEAVSGANRAKLWAQCPARRFRCSSSLFFSKPSCLAELPISHTWNGARPGRAHSSPNQAPYILRWPAPPAGAATGWDMVFDWSRFT